MTDQDIKLAYESMNEQDFKAWLHERGMVLIVDTISTNGESAPAMLYAESLWSVPANEKREPLYLGRG